MVKSGDNQSTQENQQQTPDIAELIQVLHGDVTSIDPEGAIASIDEWQAALKGTQDEGLKEISNHLKELKKLLGGKRTKAADIGAVLIQLGEETNKAGDEAERGNKGNLHNLGKALSKVGKSLESAEGDEASSSRKQSDVEADESEEGGPDIAGLIEILHGDVTSIDPEAAIESIDAWQGVLKGSKDEGSKAISASLKDLKHQLGLKKPHTDKIAEILTQLGDQTDEAASEAERGTKGQLRDLGKALHKVAKSIEKSSES
ncbi:MAG: hypothetical protein F6K28_46330 [Microcoleus sp. SIO2G3]|nr:hypothetical protein [Microcoleus sp. SIO2G3]